MFSRIFLGMSLVGAEWVLYLLIALSVVSVGLIIERGWFYRKAAKGLPEFRQRIRVAIENGRWNDIKMYAEERTRRYQNLFPDMESELVLAMAPPAKEELAHDAILRAKLAWEQNLVYLATIGSNAPFVGLFGTVLGIIKAFHSLSEQAGSGVPTVTAGISEALVATAVGILVAIPSVVAFNLFQRRIKAAVSEAEALKSFLLGKMS